MRVKFWIDSASVFGSILTRPPMVCLIFSRLLFGVWTLARTFSCLRRCHWQTSRCRECRWDHWCWRSGPWGSPSLVGRCRRRAICATSFSACQWGKSSSLLSPVVLLLRPVSISGSGAPALLVRRRFCLLSSPAGSHPAFLGGFGWLDVVMMFRVHKQCCLFCFLGVLICRIRYSAPVILGVLLSFGV